MTVQITNHDGIELKLVQSPSLKEFKKWFYTKYDDTVIVRIWYRPYEYSQGDNPDIVKGEGKSRFRSTEAKSVSTKR